GREGGTTGLHYNRDSIPLARLILEDSTVYDGESFGSTTDTIGEVVFNTSLTGYQEIATDPSYRFQIVTMTYPHIGNYGIESQVEQSEAPQVAGFVVRDAIETPSNAHSQMSLAEYFERNRIAAIQGVDTRADAEDPHGRGDARHDHHIIAQRGGHRGRSAARPVDVGPRSGAARHRAARLPIRRASQRDEEAHRGVRLRVQARHPTPADAGRMRGHGLPRHHARRRNPRHKTRRRAALERPRRSRAGDVRGGKHPRHDRQDPHLRHLPRTPAPGPRPRRQNVQAQIRPPRRQPPGEGPSQRPRGDHRAKSRLRRRPRLTQRK